MKITWSLWSSTFYWPILAYRTAKKAAGKRYRDRPHYGNALSPACRLSPIGPAQKTLARALREPQGVFWASLAYSLPGKITGFASGWILRLPQIQHECGKFTPQLLQDGYANANLPLTGAVKVEDRPPVLPFWAKYISVFLVLSLGINVNPSGGNFYQHHYGALRMVVSTCRKIFGVIK